MKIASSKIVKNSSPGQFLHIKCSDTVSPILRRPISIHRVKGNTVEILYKIVGKGTTRLSERRKGEKLDCLGPLGKGFQLPFTNYHLPITNIIVAGGIGIAPLFFLTEKIAKSAIRNPVRDVSPNGTLRPQSAIAVFIGAKTKKEVLCTEKLKKMGIETHISTEDGSLGYKGLVSDLFKNHLSSVICHLSSVVYACGPKGMLKEIALLAKKNEIPCQVSFEQFMGCGIGICNACVIKTKQGYKKVCKDGPVFDAQEIDWNRI